MHEPPVHDAPTPEVFCARLKAARERRGLSLREIADVTRIGSGLLAALERGNLSRWPGGICRRAFFTAYADAIGLPIEPTLAAFLRLFPEQDPLPPPVEPAAPEGRGWPMLARVAAGVRRWLQAPAAGKSPRVAG